MLAEAFGVDELGFVDDSVDLLVLGGEARGGALANLLAEQAIFVLRR